MKLDSFKGKIENCADYRIATFILTFFSFIHPKEVGEMDTMDDDEDDEEAVDPVESTSNLDGANASYDDALFNDYFPLSGRTSDAQGRTFDCEECGKVFHKRRKLAAHMKIHRCVKFCHRFLS
jgi:hypothetical protein